MGRLPTHRGLLACLLILPAVAEAGNRKVEPSTVVPMEKIAPANRAGVAEVIRENTFHRLGKAETFPCDPKVYLALLNQPPLTLALWQDLGSTPASLKQVGPDRYTGTDGQGTTASWEFVLRSPQVHVLLCDLDYLSPRGNARLNARIVLVVRSGFFKEVNGEPWVQHELEAFVKVDTRGWKAVAGAVRPLIERILEEQVTEAGWFVSMMGRLVLQHPDWATETSAKPANVRPEVKREFRELVARIRRPGASTSRPQMVADAQPAETKTR